jgi:hypothetical protein
MFYSNGSSVFLREKFSPTPPVESPDPMFFLRVYLHAKPRAFSTTAMTSTPPTEAFFNKLATRQHLRPHTWYLIAVPPKFDFFFR